MLQLWGEASTTTAAANAATPAQILARERDLARPFREQLAALLRASTASATAAARRHQPVRMLLGRQTSTQLFRSHSLFDAFHTHPGDQAETDACPPALNDTPPVLPARVPALVPALDAPPPLPNLADIPLVDPLSDELPPLHGNTAERSRSFLGFNSSDSAGIASSSGSSSAASGDDTQEAEAAGGLFGQPDRTALFERENLIASLVLVFRRTRYNEGFEYM